MYFPWIMMLSDARSIIYAIPISLFSILFHEMSHAIVGYRYGLDAKYLHISVYAYFSMMFYIELPGIYLLSSSKRVKIWTAGVFSNLFLASVFYCVSVNSSGQIMLFSSIAAVTNLSVIITNMFPFFHTDGYYILSTILETPNLGEESFSRLTNVFKGRWKKEDLIYGLYSVLAVILISGFILMLLPIKQIQDGSLTFSKVIKNYMNVFILFILASSARIARRIKLSKYSNSK